MRSLVTKQPSSSRAIQYKIKKTRLGRQISSKCEVHKLRTKQHIYSSWVDKVESFARTARKVGEPTVVKGIGNSGKVLQAKVEYWKLNPNISKPTMPKILKNKQASRNIIKHLNTQ